MNYIREQKELLLNKLFDGVICFDILNNKINIIHKTDEVSYYDVKNNIFYLSYFKIWRFFETDGSYLQVQDLTSAILKALTLQNKLTTDFTSRCLVEPE